MLHRMGYSNNPNDTADRIEANNYFTFGNSPPYILQALLCLCELWCHLNAPPIQVPPIYIYMKKGLSLTDISLIQFVYLKLLNCISFSCMFFAYVNSEINILLTINEILAPPKKIYIYIYIYNNHITTIYLLLSSIVIAIVNCF